MSYEKITVPSKCISFYYTLETLFNDASVRSMYQARNLKDPNGLSNVDDISITEDERNIHLSLVEDAVYDVFTNFLKYTQGITDAIAHNVNYTPSGGQQAKTSYVKIVDNENYNANYLAAVDKNLFKAVRHFVLRDWYNLQGMDKESQLNNGLYMLALRNVKNYSFQLKKESI